MFFRHRNMRKKPPNQLPLHLVLPGSHMGASNATATPHRDCSAPGSLSHCLTTHPWGFWLGHRNLGTMVQGARAPGRFMTGRAWEAACLENNEVFCSSAKSRTDKDTSLTISQTFSTRQIISSLFICT